MKQVICFALLCAVAFAGVARQFSNNLASFDRKTLETNVWVVLAAGSNGYYNYRHQADICHGYQVMHNLGIPDEHIIVFMYDDIAGSSQNPKKGQIINEPNGPDVYKGVPHDYTGKLVTGANFMKLLRGEDMSTVGGSGKTLKSTENDHVFVFFDDHGSEGALCFPEGCTLTAAKVEETINAMSNNKLFGKLIWYVEACFAGSDFYKAKLPPNVYVTTASPVGESSFAYNYDSTIRAYVADIYSYLAIHNTETAQLSESFQSQFQYIEDNIQNYSQCCQYGDYETFGSMTLNEFFKPQSSNRFARGHHYSHPVKPMNIKNNKVAATIPTDAIPIWDVPISVARHVYQDEPTAENLATLKKEEAFRVHVDEMGQRIISAATVVSHLRTPACTTCDSSCKCYSYCISGKSAAYCQFECCNERGCYEDPPKFGIDPVKKNQCVEQLVGTFLEECGNDHPYLRSVEPLFIRTCKDPSVNVEAAVNQIHIECKH